MKITWIAWWVVNVFWLVLFSIGTVFVWTREIDGAGAVQTPEAKLLSFIVLLLAFLFPFIVQIVWLILNVVFSRKRIKKNGLSA